MPTAAQQKRDYYEVLGVARTATQEEVPIPKRLNCAGNQAQHGKNLREKVVTTALIARKPYQLCDHNNVTQSFASRGFEPGT